MVEVCIFRNAASPYLPLLKAAGCELGDIQTLVKKDGLESTLGRLRREGVFFTFEEFKGRESVERPGVSFEVHNDDFANPKSNRHVSTRTTGSTGQPIKTWTSLEDRESWLPNLLTALDVHRLVGAPSAWFWPAEPSSVASSLAYSKLGQPQAWFAPAGRRSPRDALVHGLARRMIASAARLGGVRLPKIEWVDPEDALPVARWAEKKLRVHGQCLVEAGVSGALRLALASIENGIDLNGAAITGTGEPPTPAKVRAITRTGATWIPWYAFYEGGFAGTGCADPLDGTDVHFLADRLALIQHPRRVPGSDLMVDAFNFTSLASTAPQVLLNVEIDDFGIVESRNCGCAFGDLGYDTHLREIYSFRKLTGEGVTLVGSDMIRILDEVLPSRFGGSPLDYQLVEEEDEGSFTRLSLVIHPRVRIEDEAQVVVTVLNELALAEGAVSMAGTIWAQLGTFRIRRTEPVTTGTRGKLMPLAFSRRSRA